MSKTYSMAEHESSMTIFYYKSTGIIYSYGTGIQTFDMFGQHAEDYKLILGCLILPKDVFVLDNMKLFVVDAEQEALVYNQEIIQKYSSYK